VTLQTVASLIDDARAIIYKRNMFIILTNMPMDLICVTTGPLFRSLSYHVYVLAKVTLGTIWFSRQAGSWQIRQAGNWQIRQAGSWQRTGGSTHCRAGTNVIKLLGRNYYFGKIS